MEPTLNFQSSSQENINQSNFNIEYYKKVVKLSEQEIKNHKNYLKNNLKKNYFN